MRILVSELKQAMVRVSMLGSGLYSMLGSGSAGMDEAGGA
jgi:hypothetical protein